jgi:PIN domain nuclease of toxin-antitoxin system
VNYLLDTHTLLWWREGSRKLGTRARQTLERDAAVVYVSAASAWELAIKSRIGRLTLAGPLHQWLPEVLERGQFAPLAVTLEHAAAVASLADHHPDPFDRLLVAQAQLEGLTIITADAVFDHYEVQVLDARH